MDQTDNSKHNSGKLNNFLVQGGILAAAGILVKVLGILKRIPMPAIIGDVGNSYYSAAFEIYNIAITISCYGIPLSVSKLVAARVNKGQYKNAQKLFKCALSFALFMGILSSTIVFFFADSLSRFINEPMSYLPLRVLAPTLLVVSVMGVFRGYFQGTGTMIPTAVSQILEQIFVVGIGLSSAFFLSKKGEKVGRLLHNPNYKNAYGAAGATLGCLCGAIVALVFLIIIFRKFWHKQQRKAMRDPADRIEDTFYIYKTLILTILPVLLSATVNNISNFLDQYLHNKIMVERGLIEIKSVNWGIYSGKYLVLIGVPIAMAASMGASAVPTLSGLMRNKEYDEAAQRITSVLRITMIITIPCAVGMFVLAPQIMYFLFGSTSAIAANLLRIGSIGVVLFSISTLTNSILQGMSKLAKPIIHGLIALAIHVTLLVCLLKFTDLHIYAVALSNNVFALIIGILNIWAISRTVPYKQEIKYTFLYPLGASAVMGGVVFALNKILLRKGFSRPLILIEILIATVIYILALLFTRAVTREEILQFPGGTKLVRLFERFHLL